MRIVHIYHEANCATDLNLMASKGHNLPLGLRLYRVPPMDLRAVLAEDYRGVAFSHLIR